MKQGFFLLFILLSLNSFGQRPITISGRLKMKAGTTLRIWKYTDNISFERQILCTTKSNTDSSFNFSVPLPNTQLLNISANEFCVQILFDPDQNYVFDLTPSSSPTEKSFQISSGRNPLMPQNDLIKAYETVSDSAISLLFGRSNQRPSPTNIKQFNSAIDNGLQKINNKYCRDIVQSLRIHFLTLSRANSFATAINTYYHCENLPIENPAFQSLVSENFQSYFKSGPPSITRYNLFSGIPDSVHYTDLLTLLAVDSSLTCRQIREMALLSNIYNMIRDDEIDPEKGNNLLKEGAEKSSDLFNQRLASNLAHSLAIKKSGSSFPDFSIISPEGNSINISRFKGKALHLTFFSFKGMADRNLLNQLTDVAHFADSLGVAKFICITTDPNREEIIKFWNEKKYPMQLYFAPDDYALIDFFNITSLPFFVLLDAEGKLNSLMPNFPGEFLLKQIIGLHPAGNRSPANHQPDSKSAPSILQDHPLKK